LSRYLLDTTAIIDFSKGREPTRSRILDMIDAGDELGVCAINVAEFYSGLPAERRDVWRNFLMALPYWEIAHETAENAGVQRYSLDRAGRNVSTTDALVASVARQHNATIITENVKDFLLDGTRGISLQNPPSRPRQAPRSGDSRRRRGAP